MLPREFISKQMLLRKKGKGFCSRNGIEFLLQCPFRPIKQRTSVGTGGEAKKGKVSSKAKPKLEVKEKKAPVKVVKAPQKEQEKKTQVEKELEGKEEIEKEVEEEKKDDKKQKE